MSRMTGWTGLFGSRSSKRKPDPRIRWFGKLPTYADYYSSGSDEDWVVEFNDWILEGFEKYLRFSREKRTAGAPSARSSGPPRVPAAGLMIRLPKSDMTVFASVQDYGGDMVGRPFPLCFYVAVPTARWTGPTSDQLAGATRVVEDLMGLHHEIVHFLNAPGGFKSLFEDRELDLTGVDGQSSDDSWLQDASRISMADWFDAAREELGAADLEAWFGHVGRWGDRIAALESGDFEPTLCLPLARTVNLHLQTAGWIRWLESRLNLKRRALSLLLTGGSGDGQMRRLFVIARDPRAEDFVLLTPLGSSLRYVDDLCRTEDPAGSARADAQREVPVRKPLPAGSWADFVQAEAKLAR
jgi:hypothetical protein